MKKTVTRAIALTKVPLGRKQYIPAIMLAIALFTGALYLLRHASIVILPILFILFALAYIYFSLRRLSNTGLSRWWAITPPLCIILWVALIVRFAIAPSVPFPARVILIAVPLLAVFITLAMALIPGKRNAKVNS